MPEEISFTLELSQGRCILKANGFEIADNWIISTTTDDELREIVQTWIEESLSPKIPHEEFDKILGMLKEAIASKASS